MKTAVLISSCDAFNDCWKPMIYSIRKSWPDCPFPIYIISNFKEITDKSVKFIKVGEDLGFASNLKNALKRVDCEYLIYLQEDYFIDHIVDNQSIENHIVHCVENNIDFLKIGFDSTSRDEFRIDDSDYCKNPIDIKYSLNTVIAIWRKDTLEKICVEGFNGWDFERKIISYVLDHNININSETIHSSFFPQKGIKCVDATAVRRGRWTQSGLNYLKNHGFEEIAKNRKIEGPILTYFISFYSPRSFLRIPLSIVIKILQKLNI